MIGTFGGISIAMFALCEPIWLVRLNLVRLRCDSFLRGSCDVSRSSKEGGGEMGRDRWR